CLTSGPRPRTYHQGVLCTPPTCNHPEDQMGRNNRMGKLVKPFRVDDGRKFRLKDHDPGDSNGLDSKEKAERLLAKGVARLAELQDRLYAQDKWAVLLIFQAMDAAGK